MSRRRSAALLATCLAVAAAACTDDDSPYPPGYEGLPLGTAQADLLRQRPACKPDGSHDRCHDATGPAAFKFIDGKVAGLRVFVPHPVSAALLARYTDSYAAHKLPGAENKYDVAGHVLQVTSAEGGIEVAYGDDPGIARQALGPPQPHGSPGAVGLTPSVDVPRSRGQIAPAAWPEKETVAGVELWTVPVVGSGTGAASLRVIIASGSSDEASEGIGTTAALTALIVTRLHREALSERVDLRGRALRNEVIFSVEGRPASVAKLTNKLGRALNGLAQQRLRDRALRRGHQASLARSVGRTFDARTLEDEALAAMFSIPAFIASPADAERPRPSLEALDDRASGFTSASVTVVAAGAIPKPALHRFARAIGPRPSVDRRPPVPQLPGKTSRVTAGVGAAVEGVWFQTRDPADFAQLYLLAGVLRASATRAARKSGAPPPLAVRVGGWAPASYLQVIFVGGPGSTGALDGAVSRAVDALESTFKEMNLEALRRGVRSGFVHRLSAVDTAADFMTELVSLGLTPERFKALWIAMDGVDAIKLQAGLPRIIRADRRFSLRWAGGS